MSSNQKPTTKLPAESPSTEANKDQTSGPKSNVDSKEQEPRSAASLSAAPSASLDQKNQKAKERNFKVCPPYKTPITNDEQWRTLCQMQWHGIMLAFETSKLNPMHTFSWKDLNDSEPHEQRITFSQHLAALRDKDDVVDLMEWFDMIYEKAPNHPSVHGWPGWNPLCQLRDSFDLCFGG